HPAVLRQFICATFPLPPHSSPLPYTTLFRSRLFEVILRALELLQLPVDLPQLPVDLHHFQIGEIIAVEVYWQLGEIHRELKQFRSEEHTSELQSLTNHECRLPLETKNTTSHQ